MWIIGDIHGCARELEKLLRQIPDSDPLLFLGDYVDRGPDSYRVIEMMIAVADRATFLKGNHEHMLWSHYHDPDSADAAAWRYAPNGAPATLQSYKLTYESPYDAYPPAHQRFLEDLVYYYEGDDFIAVHAGVRPGQPLKKQSEQDLLWIRHDWLRAEARWSGKFVYFGHTPSRYVLGEAYQHDPIKGKKSLGLDTGVVFGGSLSAYHTKSKELIQVKAEKAYY